MKLVFAAPCLAPLVAVDDAPWSWSGGGWSSVGIRCGASDGPERSSSACAACTRLVTCLPPSLTRCRIAALARSRDQHRCEPCLGRGHQRRHECKDGLARSTQQLLEPGASCGVCTANRRSAQHSATSAAADGQGGRCLSVRSIGDVLDPCARFGQQDLQQGLRGGQAAAQVHSGHQRPRHACGDALKSDALQQQSDRALLLLLLLLMHLCAR
jgi:hypothetical protein